MLVTFDKPDGTQLSIRPESVDSISVKEGVTQVWRVSPGTTTAYPLPVCGTPAEVAAKLNNAELHRS